MDYQSKDKYRLRLTPKLMEINGIQEARSNAFYSAIVCFVIQQAAQV